MRKNILTAFACAATILFSACEGVEESTVEGTLVTKYNTIPDRIFTSYAGTQEETASKLLYTFMTDQNNLYWEYFSYTDHFNGYTEYAKLEAKRKKQCVEHYYEQKAKLENENLNLIFENAPDSCVFTAVFPMTLPNFGEGNDTTFTVQRPVILNTQWNKIESSGTIDITSIRFLTPSSAQLQRDTETENVRYIRSGNQITISDINQSLLYILRLQTVNSFELFNNTNEIKYGEYQRKNE